MDTKWGFYWQHEPLSEAAKARLRELGYEHHDGIVSSGPYTDVGSGKGTASGVYPLSKVFGEYKGDTIVVRPDEEADIVEEAVKR